MSLVHTRSGACGVNSRSSRFSATGSSWLLSVVALNLRLPRALMPCSFISLRTRSLPTRMPRPSSSYPHPRPAILAACLGVHSAYVYQQRVVADVASRLDRPDLVLVVSTGAHARNFAGQ